MIFSAVPEGVRRRLGVFLPLLIGLGCSLAAVRLISIANIHGWTKPWFSTIPTFLSSIPLYVGIVAMCLRGRRYLKIASFQYKGCLECGYDMRNIEVPTCPECGASYDPSRSRRITEQVLGRRGILRSNPGSDDSSGQAGHSDDGEGRPGA